MINQGNGLQDLLRRELIRAILERIQGASLQNRMGLISSAPAEVPENVEEFLDNPYINRNGVPLAMDIFKPKVPAGTELPVLVMIHGGGLVMGDRTISREFGRVVAQRGYLVFSIEYRLAPRANVCEQFDDVCAGLDLIGQKLVDYDVDFTRIFLAAESAGAYLATYVAAMKNSEKLQNAIGYEPSRITFKAIGLFSGMFYTRRNDPIGLLLSEQFFGDKRADQNFLQYMDPEHPEIIWNLPPTFLITSRGDFLNNYTLMYHKVLKRAGKATHLLYYGEQELGHAFVSSQPNLPQSQDAIDKMLKWFEDQANIERKKTMKSDKKRTDIEARIADGSIGHQKSWKFVKELNSVSEERLNAVAIINGEREYTYRQMFRTWDNYAEVFSALGITGKNHARMGLQSIPTTEMIFSFYALNMVGTAVSAIPMTSIVGSESWKRLVKTEGITDLLLSDILVRPQTLSQLMREKEELGLRNIILVHTNACGPCVNAAESAFLNGAYTALKNVPNAVFLHDLLTQYEAYPIVTGGNDYESPAVIVHTSGTTKGISKPIPLSDKALNAAALHIMQSETFRSKAEHSISCITQDLSAAYGLADQMHTPFALGGATVITYFAGLKPDFVKIIEHYHINIVFTSAGAIGSWMKMPPNANYSLSSLDIVVLGGMYVSPEKRKQLNGFLKAHGCNAGITNGYGLSEAAGACILSPGDREDDSIGFVLPGVNVKLLDDDGKFYSLDDGPRRGVLYVSSESLSDGRLDDMVFFELDEIDGEKYLNTHDYVILNEDKSLTYAGRENRFFVNNEGVRFDAGLVETAVAAQPGIDACALVPIYGRQIHDTIPVLYVKTSTPGAGDMQTVKQALFKVFITNNSIEISNLPSMCMITDAIPYNANGKVDVYQITCGKVNGKSFNIMPVRSNGKLVDVNLMPVPGITGDKFIGAVPEELAANQKDDLWSMLSNLFSGTKSGKPDFKMPFQIPGFGQNQQGGFQLPNFPCFNQQQNSDGQQQGCQMPNMPFPFPGFWRGGFRFPYFPCFNQQQNAGGQQQGCQMPNIPFPFPCFGQGGFRFPNFPCFNQQQNNDGQQQGFKMPNIPFPFPGFRWGGFQLPNFPCFNQQQNAGGQQQGCQMPNMPFPFPGFGQNQQGGFQLPNFPCFNQQQNSDGQQQGCQMPNMPFPFPGFWRGGFRFPYFPCFNQQQNAGGQQQGCQMPNMPFPFPGFGQNQQGGFQFPNFPCFNQQQNNDGQQQNGGAPFDPSKMMEFGTKLFGMFFNHSPIDYSFEK